MRSKTATHSLRSFYLAFLHPCRPSSVRLFLAVFAAIIGMNTIILVLGIIFLCYSMMVYDACYVDPCYEGSGLEELWKVNKGIGFTTIAAGICTCMIAIFIDVFLSLGLDPSATFTIGYVLGASSVTGLVMLDMTFVWAAEWNLVYDLHQLKGDNAIFDESGRHMVVRTELIGQSKAMLGLAIAWCALARRGGLGRAASKPPGEACRHDLGAR